jgi:hypothetical protein
MPYIDKRVRGNLDEEKEYQFIACATEAGALNYLLTNTVIQYCRDNGLSYNRAINAIVGALECCKLEFYRRVAAPYEDKAIKRNGDVYPPELVSHGEEEK